MTPGYVREGRPSTIALRVEILFVQEGLSENWPSGLDLRGDAEVPGSICAHITLRFPYVRYQADASLLRMRSEHDVTGFLGNACAGRSFSFTAPDPLALRWGFSRRN
jgi:hypothetical protein